MEHLRCLRAGKLTYSFEEIKKLKVAILVLNDINQVTEPRKLHINHKTYHFSGNNNSDCCQRNELGVQHNG